MGDGGGRQERNRQTNKNAYIAIPPSTDEQYKTHGSLTKQQVPESTQYTDRVRVSDKSPVTVSSIVRSKTPFCTHTQEQQHGKEDKLGGMDN